MRTFRYEDVRDTASAVELLAERPAARVLAGGTNLVDLMRLGVERPESLVDISRLGLDRVERLRNGDLRIGAAVRNADLAADPMVRERYPVLGEALLAGAPGQLRTLATTAGNLLQRTRCGYFQDIAMPCNKREPGSGCPAIEGQHDNLAILGGSTSCVATHASDMAVAMTALDAVVEVEGTHGRRSVPLDDLYLLPEDTPEQEHTLAHDELVTGVVIPALPFGARSRYRKVREHASFAFAIASVAVALDVRDGVVRDVRLGFGAVAPKPWRATLAEDVLRGRPATVDEFTHAVDEELRAACPLRDNAYKVPLIRRLAVAVLAELAAA